MEKSLLTLALAFLLTMAISEKSAAQEYQAFPTKCAKWEVYRCWYFYQPGWHDKYTLTLDGSDTIYNGDTYKKINIIEHHLPGTIYDTLHPPVFFGGMREVNKKIYIFQIWASVDTLPNLVYDFTKTALGDTIYTKALSGNKNPFPHLVVGVDSVAVGNKYHKRLELQDPKNKGNTEYWIEGIGSSMGLPWATFWSITDNTYDLSCFNTTKKVVYENPNPTFGMCTGTLPTISCDSSSDCDTVNNCKLNMVLMQNANQLKAAQDSATYQWIDCSSMLALSGATSQTYSAQSNGFYAVIIKRGTCVDTSECAEVTGLGIGDQGRRNFRVYPVPSSGKLFVELGSEYEAVNIDILTIQGQVLKTTSFTNVNHLDIDLPEVKGVYLLRLNAGQSSTVYRVVRE